MGGILLVTGASRGIGAATARLAAQRGYAVCVNYLHGEVAARELVREIEQADGKAIAVAADISVEADVLRLYRTWFPFSRSASRYRTLDATAYSRTMGQRAPHTYRSLSNKGRQL